MSCIPDANPCKSDGSLGWCCSGFCLQIEGHPQGYCAPTKTTTSAVSSSSSSATGTGYSSSSSSATTLLPGCLKGGEKCKPDGSLGTCCSYYCEKLESQEFGTCKGDTPPTGLPPACLDDGEKCQKDGSLGLCCSGYCTVLAPHIIGKCAISTTTPHPTPSGGFYAWIISASIAVPAVILIVTALVWLYRRQKKLEQALPQSETHSFFYGNPEGAIVGGYAHENVDSYPYDKEKWEVNESDFTIDWDSPLGSGCFGLVLKGKIKGEPVAVKTLKTNTMGGGTYLRSLLSEIKLLQYIEGHENIVSMIGSNTSNIEKGKVYLFLEYCPLGSLVQYLRANKSKFKPDQEDQKEVNENSYVNTFGDVTLRGNDETLETFHFLNWCLQITLALKYIEMKKVIHADIAARNVLLVRKDCAKLTDFGLSRRLYEYNSYVKKHQEPLPWRHMAPEAIRKLTFTHQSDVWSLGILFWEIFSFGDVPYPGLAWTPQFLPCLENNMRPVKPPMASNEMYDIMLDCWKPEPEERPNFEEVHKRLWDYKENLKNAQVSSYMEIKE